MNLDSIIENECPLCLKAYATKKYVFKHLFENKNKCNPPPEYNPPSIDYEKKIITWTKESKISRDKHKSKMNLLLQTDDTIPLSIPPPTPQKISVKTAIPPTPIVSATYQTPKKPQLKIQNNQTTTNRIKPKIIIPIKRSYTRGPIIKIPYGSNNKPKSNQNEPIVNTTDNTITNRYTIAVDPSGNIIDIPGKSTDNDILKDNPALQEQIKQIITGLNLNHTVNYRLPPEVEKCQKSIENILDAYGDIAIILNIGLKHELNNEPAVISMNHNDEDNILCIERIAVPDQLKIKTDRPPSFVEILYRGLYYILTKLLSAKFHFYELTRSKKASDDSDHILKYRKCVLISYLVLKKRLDHLYNLRQNDDTLEYANLMQNNHKNYYTQFTQTDMPYAHQYDNCLLVKLNMSSNLTSIELHSLNMFYENFCQLISIYEFNTVINPACEPVIEPNHADFIESEVKRYPDYKYVNINHISEEHRLFPDYDYEVINRDFTSHLIKLTPMNLARKVPYQPIEHYYKRIYVDGTAEAPIDETDYQKLKDVY